MSNAIYEEIDRLKLENEKMKSLIDGAMDVVELFGISPAQIAWRENWLREAKEILK
jgi:hypothetical protein